MPAMTKVPTRSPTHTDIDYGKLSSLGLDVEEIAKGDEVALADLIVLAEDQGKPVGHFLAAIPLATELRVKAEGPLVVKVCAGACQKWGALELLDHLVARWEKRHDLSIRPVSCLDRCDQAAACEIDGPHGNLVVPAATKQSLDEALDALA